MNCCHCGRVLGAYLGSATNARPATVEPSEGGGGGENEPSGCCFGFGWSGELEREGAADRRVRTLCRGFASGVSSESH